jgi:A/G-specific adenine glycosylase
MKSEPDQPEREPADLQSGFSATLLAWYRKNARSLPWRETKDPYAIFVAEVMLQQTQVKTVLPYYKRWMTRFPNVAQLAGASETEVLKLWEGLGYYGRARMLHQAARRIVSQYSGRFPRVVEELSELPGVGRYTLGAVASIAFGLRLPVLDGNVIRLFCRHFGIHDPVNQPKTRKLLWEQAERLLPADDIGDYNQAVMELGATVCMPRKPLCLFCPLNRTCQAFAHGEQEDLPVTAPRPPTLKQYEYAVLALHSGSVLLQQRGDGVRMARLWQFPAVLLPRPLRRWTEKWQDQYGIFKNIKKLKELDYAVTRHQIRLQFFRATGFRLHKTADARWTELAKVSELPMPAAHRKLADEFLEETNKSTR